MILGHVYIAEVGNVSEAILAVLRGLRWLGAAGDSHQVVRCRAEPNESAGISGQVIVEIQSRILGGLEVAVEVEIRPVVWPPCCRLLEPGGDVFEERRSFGPPQSLVIVFGDQAQRSVQLPVPGPRDRI